MNLGMNIQKYRKELKISQEELGQKLFVSRQTISLWEKGQTVPTIENLIRASEIFGITVDALLGGEERADDCADTCEEIPQTKPQKNHPSLGWRIVSIALFVLSFLSALAPAYILNFMAETPEKLLDMMWLFFVFTPVPIASLVFGIMAELKDRRCKKNIVAGVIVTALLCTYGAFVFVF